MASFSKISNEHPKLLLGGIFVVILCVDYFAVMQFQIKSLLSLTPKISTLSADVKATENNVQRIPQYQKEILNFTEKYKNINQKIKRKEDIPLILENVSLLANTNGIDIEQIMPDRSDDDPLLENKEGRYYAVSILLEAKGGYHDFGRFLNQLEATDILMTISHFSILGNEKNTKRHKIKLTIDTVVFDAQK